MSGLLRWIVRLAVRLSRRDRSASTTNDLLETVDQLATDARASGGRRGEAAYLCREAADALREALGGRRGPVQDRAWSGRVLDGVQHDVRSSLRHMRDRPLATAGVVGALALAVGSVATTYAVATAVLWRPLPFPDPDGLVFVWEAAGDDGGAFRVTSGRFADWSRTNRAFSQMALFSAASFSLDGPDGGRPFRGVRVGATYFDTLGLRPVLGRGFTADDETPGRDKVIVLSHAAWRQRLGARLDVIGTELRLSGEPFTVVGVMADVVTPTWPANPARVGVDARQREFWVPMAQTPERIANTTSHVYGVVARLAPGVTAERADAEMRASADPTAADAHPGMVTAFREQFVRDARSPLLTLLAASLAVLLVACANLAALHVALFESRRAEMAVRTALGAGRGRLASQLFIDATVLALFGGAAGTALAALATAWLPGALPPSIPFLTAPRIDLPVALFAAAVTGLAAVMLSAWPVMRLMQQAPTPRGTAPPGRSLVYRVVVAAQVAVSVGLAAPAALLGQSLRGLEARDLGFTIEDVGAADLALPASATRSLAQAVRFESAVRQVFAARTEVQGVALAYDHPLDANWSTSLALVGEARAPSDEGTQAQLRIVSPSYFAALDVAVVEGRPFTDSDRHATRGVMVVNESFAAAHGGHVVGRQVRDGTARYTWGAVVPEEYEIVGIVENERFRGVDQPVLPAVYVSAKQFPLTAAVLLVRARGGLASLAGDLRTLVRQVEPTTTIGPLRPLAGILVDQLAPRRITADATGAFAAAAVALATLGLYGLMAVVVTGRTRDLGIRLALGASPGRVARAVVVEGVALVTVGVAAGLLLGLATGRAVAHLLVDVSASDPVTLSAVALTLVGAALAAVAGPARRAALVDPATALRA